MDVMKNYLVQEYPKEQWIMFKPARKEIWYVKDRATLLQLLLSSGFMYFDKSLTPLTFAEMKKLQYRRFPNKNSRHPEEQDIQDVNDNGFDMVMYNLMPHARELAKGIELKSSMYNNSLRSIINSERFQ